MGRNMRRGHNRALKAKVALEAIKGEKTPLKKSSWLVVLDHPEIPLHNNPAELGRVRKRDVSIAPRTLDGAKAWDTFMTIAATAKQLGAGFYRYTHDRVSSAYDASSPL